MLSPSPALVLSQQLGACWTQARMAAEDAADEICMAAERGDVEDVKMLLDQDGGLLEARVGDGSLLRTPLMLAALEGHMEVVRFLLEEGADVKLRDADGETALHMAAAWGHEEVAAFLLSKGADARASNRYQVTALHEASCEGHVGVVRLLLQHLRGGYLDQANSDGCTALHTACYYGHTEVVKALLFAGASHTIADHNGTTPLQAALENYHEETMIRNLIQWWEGELERGYVMHRARYHVEKHSLLKPSHASSARSVVRMSAVDVFVQPRFSPPEAEDSLFITVEEQKVEGSSGKRKGAEQGGERKGPCEGEMEATLQYVIHDLAPELYIELMAGFHK